jgi:Carboxypeptidase regulatory-like domain
VHAILVLIVLVALQPKPTGTITGRVTLEDSGAPAADVAIECVARGGPPSERAQTDSEGRYQCRVPPGVYRVRAQLSRMDNAYLSQTYGVRGPDDEGKGIRVRADARVDVPFVLRRSGTISGRVLDDHGVPLKDAIVTAQRESTDDPGFGGFSIGDSKRPGIRPLERTATIEGGSFSIGGLPSGVYRVYAEPPDRAVAPDKDGRRLVPTWYPSSVDPRYAIPVQVNGDDLAGVDLVLARSRMPDVSGFVVRADGSPAAGLQVHLVAGNTLAISSMSATSGAKGDFRFESVAPGAYQLVGADASGAPVAMASVTLVVGDSNVSGLLLSPGAGSMVNGRVRFEGEGFPMASASVDAQGTDPLAFFSRATTDPKWGFVLPPVLGIGPRLFRVGGLPKGWWLKSVIAARRDITNESVDLTEGLEGIDILVSNRMSTLSGVVEAVEADASNLPADTAVLVFSDDSSKWVAASTAIARVWPTEDGKFVAEGLPAGSYRVIAIDVTPPGFLRAAPEVLRSLSERATPVTLGEGETLQVKIPLVRRE